MFTYGGVDLGVTGSLCFRNTAIPRNQEGAWEIIDMPVIQTTIKKKGGKTGTRSHYNVPLLCDILKERKERLDGLVFERLHAVPNNVKNKWAARKGIQSGSLAEHSKAHGMGILEGLCVALGIRYYKVAPQTWKAAMLAGLVNSRDDKNAIRLVAMQQYPELSQYLARVKDHNRAESVFICEHGLKNIFPSMDGWSGDDDLDAADEIEGSLF